MYIVSACLLGANCKYNGGNNDNEAVKDFCEGHKVLAVCPETAGGLSAPRPPAEQVVRQVYSRDKNAEQVPDALPGCDDCRTEIRIINKEGEDLTDAFRRGAEICFKKVLAACEQSESDPGEEPELAILKANSPSCGCGKIYDGTFSGTLTDGDGVFAKLLKERGIKVVTEDDLNK